MKDISILLKDGSDIIKISQLGCEKIMNDLNLEKVLEVLRKDPFKIPIIVFLNAETNEYEEFSVGDKSTKDEIQYSINGSNILETDEAVQYIVKNRFLFRNASNIYIGSVRGLNCIFPVIIAVSKNHKNVNLYVILRGYVEQFTLQCGRWTVEETAIKYLITNSREVSGYVEFLSWFSSDDTVKYDTEEDMLFTILYLFPAKYIDHLARITSSIFIGEICPSGHACLERELYAINISTMSCVKLDRGMEEKVFDNEDSKKLHANYVNLLKKYGLAYQGGILCKSLGLVGSYYSVYALNKKFFLAVNIDVLLTCSYDVYKMLVSNKNFADYAIQSRETLMRDDELIKEYKQEIRSLYGFKDCLN